MKSFIRFSAMLILSCFQRNFSFSFSSTSTPVPGPLHQTQLIQTANTDEPFIVSFKNIISPPLISSILDVIENPDQLVATHNYQEDVFSTDAWDREVDVLQKITQPFIEDIPSEYSTDPLQAFVYSVMKFKIPSEDIIRGANIIKRRQALERWKSEEGQALMKLSLDNDSDEEVTLGKRYQVPPDISSELFNKVIPRILKKSPHWVLRDATFVKYKEGDSQVPHLDPCDATLLICLKSCKEGGDLCFPLLEDVTTRRVANVSGSGILFFSSQIDGNRNSLGLHHGGKVIRGEKIVIQLMLDFVDNNDHENKKSKNGSVDEQSTNSWLDLVSFL